MRAKNFTKKIAYSDSKREVTYSEFLNNSKKIITVSNFSKNEISNHYSISAEKIDVI